MNYVEHGYTVWMISRKIYGVVGIYERNNNLKITIFKPFYAVLFITSNSINSDRKAMNRKAMNRNWSNQKANPTLKTKAGNK